MSDENEPEGRASFQIREARESDSSALMEIYVATYGDSYCYPWVYDDTEIRKLVLSDDTLILVAEDTDASRVIGTAALTLEAGAYSDLVGEFGRLAVHPDARRRGVAGALMAERVRRAPGRVQVGYVEARTSHAYSQTVALRHGFSPVGFLPLKLRFQERESAATLVRYFDDALSLRRNHPRVAPAVYPLASRALEAVGIPSDAIVDESTEAYAAATGLSLDRQATTGYAPLLRFERGRVERREVFGPMRLEYGFLRHRRGRATYLLARDGAEIVGALGVMRDDLERTVRAFELIALDDRPIRFLAESLIRVSGAEWGTEYIEMDVSAYAPRMQRTLLGLGFVPAAFVPALAFHRSERLDIVKMVHLGPPAAEESTGLAEPVRPFRQLVLRSLAAQPCLPEIRSGLARSALFGTLSPEQGDRVAALCSVATFESGQELFVEESAATDLYVVLEGTVEFVRGQDSVGRVEAGATCGEMALLLGQPHSASAIARQPVRAARITRSDFDAIVDQRPDIGVSLYRALGIEVLQKLRGSRAS